MELTGWVIRKRGVSRVARTTEVSLVADSGDHLRLVE